MDTLFSYLKWRGDLSFLDAPFNEVDNLILCAFSYIKIENLWQKNRITIKELYPRFKKSLKKESVILKNQEDLFFLLAHSKRFQNVVITHLVKETSKSLEKQFCAMTFLLTNQELFIAYRGTDETLTGWKEDFNLSYMDFVPSQKRAVSYLEEVASNTLKEIYIGGHSKGGNLAMASYLFCNDETRKKVKFVYNNDGPGFKDNKFIGIEEYKKNMITFIPKTSIVGHLFFNYSNIKIIDCKNVGIFSHNLYTWKVEKDHLVTVSHFDKRVKELCNRINKMVAEIPDEKKKIIITFLYDLLDSFGVLDFDEVLNKIGQNSSLIKKHGLSIEDMQFLFQVLPTFLDLFKLLQ